MCNYREICPGRELMKDGPCFGTPTDCKIYPIMKELDELRKEIKDYNFDAEKSDNRIREIKRDFKEAIGLYKKIINHYEKILSPTFIAHDEINKLEKELENIQLDLS